MRLGRFIFSMELAEQGSSFIGGKVWPLEVKLGMHPNSREVIGISDMFRDIGEGESVPMYSIIITRGENGLTFRAREYQTQSYTEMKGTMAEYRLGKITREEMICAIGLWQLKDFGRIAE